MEKALHHVLSMSGQPTGSKQTYIDLQHGRTHRGGATGHGSLTSGQTGQSLTSHGWQGTRITAWPSSKACTGKFGLEHNVQYHITCVEPPTATWAGHSIANMRLISSLPSS